jgi:hypothetical protein
MASRPRTNAPTTISTPTAIIRWAALTDPNGPRSNKPCPGAPSSPWGNNAGEEILVFLVVGIGGIALLNKMIPKIIGNLGALPMILGIILFSRAIPPMPTTRKTRISSPALFLPVFPVAAQ